METDLQSLARNVAQGAQKLAQIKTAAKDAALRAMAKALREEQDTVLQANTKDLEAGKANGMANNLLDRLKLNPQRIEDMAQGLEQVAALKDPLGEIALGWRHPNGMEIKRVRVPLGVIGMIYEARPNVTCDAIGLCLKSGNGVLLKGGKEADNSNQALAQLLSTTAYEHGIPAGVIQQLPGDRGIVDPLIHLNEYIDLIIPRGGAGLINYVLANSSVPVLETGVGNCHIYIDRTAEVDMARRIVLNGKVQRPSVCNSLEKILIHRECLPSHMGPLVSALTEAGVEVRGCPRSVAFSPQIKPATESDWATEYLDLIVAIKVVDSTDEAIDWINHYGTGHSEAMVTNSYQASQQFTQRVDAAAVYVNASTRFTDGFEFGFGAEIGISTQKLHARGPIGLPELTSVKYVINGSGQIRE